MSGDSVRHRKRYRNRAARSHPACCARCPITERSLLLLGRSLTVHHIDSDPTNDDPKNLMRLCRPCHDIVDGMGHGRHSKKIGKPSELQGNRRREPVACGPLSEAEQLALLRPPKKRRPEPCPVPKAIIKEARAENARRDAEAKELRLAANREKIKAKAAARLLARQRQAEEARRKKYGRGPDGTTLRPRYGVLDLWRVERQPQA